jgi:hypothetical protein
MATPLLAVVGAFAYILVAGQWAPMLRPAQQEPLQFAFVLTLLSALGFGIQSALFTLHTYGGVRGLVARAEPFVVGYTQISAAAIALLAITVVAR